MIWTKYKYELEALNPLPDDKILDWSKLKQFADDNFKFDENSKKFSKRVENTVGKGEIARYKQFFLFPQCFLKASFPGASKGVIVWEWVKGLNCSTGIDWPVNSVWRKALIKNYYVNSIS